MAEIRYADLHVAPPARVVTIGSQAGPPLGEGWSQIATLPAAKMPTGAGQFAVIVTGKIGDVLLAGSAPSSGIMQVCLGTSNGTRCPHLRVSHTLTQPPGAEEGVPFQFVLVISSTYPDPVLGSSFTPTAGANELCLWARTFRNQDAANYYCEFTVADVSWLWFDLARIPSGDWAFHEVTSSTTLPSSEPTAFQELGPAVGADGETWLHFQNVWYQPMTFGAPAPKFRFLYSTDGTWANRRTPIGAIGRWGQNRRPPASQLNEIPQVQQGGFWSLDHADATTRVGYAAWEEPSATVRTFVHRYRHFAVRIDPLPDVRRLWIQVPTAGGVRLVDAWESVYVPVERPQPSPGLLTEPIVMLHQVVRWENQPAAYGCRITESGDVGTILTETLLPWADPTRGEAVSAMLLGRRAFQVLSPAMQFRNHAVGSLASPAGTQLVQDLHFLTFHPVRDPENGVTPPPPRLTPVVISPGPQSAAPASLTAPPHAPNADPLERGDHGREQVSGATGYRRTWPVGSKPVRRLSLTWGPMGEADALAVLQFLQGAPVWRYVRPHGGEDLAVMNTSRPEMLATTHRSFRVRVDVVVLVWTGGA